MGEGGTLIAVVLAFGYLTTSPAQFRELRERAAGRLRRIPPRRHSG